MLISSEALEVVGLRICSQAACRIGFFGSPPHRSRRGTGFRLHHSFGPIFPGFEVYQHGSLMFRSDYCQSFLHVSSVLVLGFFVSSPPPALDAGTWAGFLPRRRRRRTGEGGIF